MAWAAAAGLGALLAVGAVFTAVGLGLVAIERSKAMRPAVLLGQALLILLSAVTEELLFRVVLVGAVALVAPDAVAVVVSSLVFGLPHVVRGNNGAEQRANAITAAAFGLVVGAIWVAHHNFAAIVAFHAAFNVVAGLLLGGGAIDPLSERLPQVTWPFALRDRSSYTGTALMWRTAGSELLPLAVVALLLRPTGLV
jgi:membrane protease YdiL (CAAX protease family)